MPPRNTFEAPGTDASVEVINPAVRLAAAAIVWPAHGDRDPRYVGYDVPAITTARAISNSVAASALSDNASRA